MQARKTKDDNSKRSACSVYTHASRGLYIFFFHLCRRRAKVLVRSSGNGCCCSRAAASRACIGGGAHHIVATLAGKLVATTTSAEVLGEEEPHNARRSNAEDEGSDADIEASSIAAEGAVEASVWVKGIAEGLHHTRVGEENEGDKGEEGSTDSEDTDAERGLWVSGKEGCIIRQARKEQVGAELEEGCKPKETKGGVEGGDGEGLQAVPEGVVDLGGGVDVVELIGESIVAVTLNGGVGVAHISLAALGVAGQAEVELWGDGHAEGRGSGGDGLILGHAFKGISTAELTDLHRERLDLHTVGTTNVELDTTSHPVIGVHCGHNEDEGEEGHVGGEAALATCQLVGRTGRAEAEECKLRCHL